MSRMATIDAFLNTRSNILLDSLKLRFPGFACPTRVKNARQRMQTSMLSAVTAFWASPRFGHPHYQIPSVLGIPFSYYCSVVGIPLYPPGMPKSLVFWSSPLKKFWISRENRKSFKDGFRQI